jgi:nucleotide-binding universal stress UspA family protein
MPPPITVRSARADANSKDNTMKVFNKIVYVVTNETPGQAPALARAVALAQANSAALTLLTVTPNASATEAKAAMRGLKALAAPHAGRLKIGLELHSGVLFLEVIRAVLRDGHDLVIKASQEQTLVPSLFGSEDMHLLRKCPCPVLITKPDENERYRLVLAAMDNEASDSYPSERRSLNTTILELSSALALDQGAALHLVHAWEPIAFRKIRMRGDRHDFIGVVEKERARQQKALQKILKALREIVGATAFAALNPQINLPQGPARTMIPTVAEELSADIVVMGTVARTGIAGFIIGNTAESIINRLPCAVLAVKPPGFSTPVDLPEVAPGPGFPG